MKRLKDVLKPPFKDSGYGMITASGHHLLDAPGIIIARIRGWGFFSHFKNGEELQDKWTEFVVRALNEQKEV